MLFIQQFLQNIFLRFRTLFGPLTSVWMRMRIYMRPGQAIRNQFAGVTARFQSVRSRMGSFGNAIIPPSIRKRLGLDKPKRRKKGGEAVDGDDEFGELSGRKGRRLGGGRKLKPLQQTAQFSQIHLINDITKARKVAHIGKKIDRSWTEMFVEVDEENSVRLSFTIVDKAVYGATVAITYEKGDADILVDGVELTSDVSLPVRDESVITVADVPYVVDMFRYESLPAKTRMDAAWVTNVGPVRNDNQDAIGLYQHPDAYMFTIADGVGGGYAGDIVSEYSVKYLLKTFQKNIKHNLSWIDILLKAYQHTNAEVRAFVERSPYSAGTTLTTVVIREWTAYIAHVGDSRVYHLRGTQFRQLTDDHRETHPVERTTKYEHIPDEFLPMRDVLVRAIGKRDIIDPQIITMALQPGDQLLMITDGITHQISDEEIYNTLITESIDDAPDTLVRIANERENTDNASVILLNVMEQAYEQDIWNAVGSSRVYIGGKNWKLDLTRPTEMNTDYELPNQLGCMSTIMTLLLCAFIWWGVPQLFGGNETVNSAQVVETGEATMTEQVMTTSQPTNAIQVDVTATNRATIVSVSPTSASVDDVTENPDDPTEITPEAVVEATHTPTQIILPPTATPTATPFVTQTPRPTLPATVGPSATPIPPTSTLRA